MFLGRNAGPGASEAPDIRLLPLLAEGVSEAHFQNCLGACSGRPKKMQTCLTSLQEISNGWVVCTDMSVEQARQHWHKGKLNVVRAEGKESRLVLDSTVCGVNPKCNIPHRASLPTASDVRLAFMPEDTHAFFPYWWQRTATRSVISTPHKAWFVGDLLAALRRPDAHQQLALIIIFLAAISAPIFWKKVQFQNCLTWCEWSINFLLETIHRLKL